MSDELKAKEIGRDIVLNTGVDIDVCVHGSIDSTNVWALQQSKQGKKIPFACFAEQQTHGKGRRGKSWLTLPNANIAMSLVWVFDLSSQRINLLPLTIALAVVRTLEALGLQKVKLKWPNDVYVNARKIAGILIETQPLNKALAPSENAVAVIIGVGLNYDMSSFQAEMIDESMASLVLTDVCSELENKRPARQLVASLLLQNIVEVCQDFDGLVEENLNQFRQHYDFCKNEHVQLVLDNGDVLTGVALGVTDEAELVVKVGQEERVFNSAEVSVKARSVTGNI